MLQVGSYQDVWDACDRCEADPASVPLHEALLAAIEGVDDSEGATIVVADRLFGLGQPPQIRAMIASQLLDVVARERALAWAHGDEPEPMLVRCECLVLMDRHDEARALYADLQRRYPLRRSAAVERGLAGG